MRRLSLLPALLVLLASPVSALAEDGGPVCGEKSALYGTDSSVRVWATRRGEMERENPLLPLSPDRLVVLQVVVNNRLATAYGPDFDHLRQGGPPGQLERDSSAPIRWAAGPVAMPDAIRVVGEDGSVILGPLAFSGCADAPAAKAAPAPRRTDAKADRRPAGGGREPPGLPQGAIPSLTLPGARGN